MYRLEITFSELPASLNIALRMNRYKANRKNKLWDFLVLNAVRGKRPEKPLQKARIRIVRHFWQTLDYDGLVGSMKPVVDGLVTAGVLHSDSWNVLGVWEVTQCFRPKKSGPLLEVLILEA